MPLLPDPYRVETHSYKVRVLKGGNYILKTSCLLHISFKTETGINGIIVTFPPLIPLMPPVSFSRAESKHRHRNHNQVFMFLLVLLSQVLCCWAQCSFGPNYYTTVPVEVGQNPVAPYTGYNPGPFSHHVRYHHTP